MSENKGIEKIVAMAMRQSRENALDAAIEICELFAMTGHSAECCVKALRDMKGMLSPAPSDIQ